MKNIKRILCMLIAFTMLLPFMMIATPAEEATATTHFERTSTNSESIIYFDNVKQNGANDVSFTSGTKELWLHHCTGEVPPFASATTAGYGMKLGKTTDTSHMSSVPFSLQINAWPFYSGMDNAKNTILSIHFKVMGADAAHLGEQTAPADFNSCNSEGQLKAMKVNIQNDTWITYNIDVTKAENWVDGKKANNYPGSAFFNICFPTLNDEAYYLVDYVGYFESVRNANLEAAEQEKLWNGVPVAPTVSVAAGKYFVPQSVELKTITVGAKIYYTVNGTEPTKDSTEYTGPITVSESLTLKAIAYNPDNGAVSSVTEAVYEIDSNTCATPTFSTIGKEIPKNSKVIITCSTPDAKIYYTTDGSAPTTASTRYTAPITVSTLCTIKAIAVKEGFTDSEIAVAEYEKLLPEYYFWSFENLLTGDKNGNFTPAQGVYHNDTFPTIYCDQTGIVNDEMGGIMMTIPAKGEKDPGRSGFRFHPDDGDTPETAPIPNGNYHYMVVVYKSEKEITLKWNPDKFGKSENKNMKESIAVTLPASTTYTKVVISMDETNAEWKTVNVGNLHFQVDFLNDSDTPVPMSLLYVGFFADKETAENTDKTGAPIASKKSGEYESAIDVTLSSATESAKIYYTTDGSTPSASNGTLYTGAIKISSNLVLKAIAIKDGASDSAVMTYTYTVVIRVKQPEIDLKAGKYEGEQTVTITTATEGAKIYYTTDGSTPSVSNGTLYEGPIKLSKTCILKVIAVKEGMEDSEVNTRNYNIVTKEQTNETTGDNPGFETKPNDDSTKKDGCGSSVSVGLLSIVGLIGVAGYAIVRKKEN